MSDDESVSRDDRGPLTPEAEQSARANQPAQPPSGVAPQSSQDADLRSPGDIAAHASEPAAKVDEDEVSSPESTSATRENTDADRDYLQNRLEEHVVRLQDVNKRLVIANVNAQILAERLEGAKAEMAHLAHHDYLTNLPNRIQLEENLTQAIKFARRHGTKVGLLFIDLDRFKIVNDSLGHDIGDQLLQAVAQRLLMSIRDADTVSRQGGDEFVVLLSDIHHSDELVASVEKIHHIITEPYSVAQHVLHIGASIGVSIYPDDGADNATLIKHADAAMYAAKEGGRNSYAFFEKKMNERAVTRHQFEVSLRDAIVRKEFVLHYQAQFDLKTGDISGAEALIRWRHPVSGLLYPTGFMAFAQECGVMLPIGRWVLHEACEQARKWEESGLAIDVIAVNISAPEFESKDFLEYVISVLHDTGLSPHRLELELTEGVMMRDCDATIHKLDALRALGVRIAIDDFGTGYSSLSYLKRFPIDTLKIDQSFVGDIRDGTDDILVGAVIDIGNRMKHQVVAEGIETSEQLDFLRARQCTSGQGFHLAKPISADDFTHILVTRSQHQQRTPGN